MISKVSTNTNGAWLSILGIGEDGLSGLSSVALALLSAAELVVGGARHLRLVEEQTKGRETLAWPTPLEAAMPQILARRGRPVVVLASGDPFCYGVGVTLSRHIPFAEMLSIPQPSAFSLAANRLGWAVQDVGTLALNGRALERIVPLLRPGAKIIALSADGATPRRVAELLAARGFGPSRLHVLSAMGGPRERRSVGTAASFAIEDIDALNTIAIEVVAEAGARVLPRACGLPDDWFEHDGQITKREVRVLTLSVLAPRAGEHLWDIGCGSGSVGIEWMLAEASCRASAVDIDAERAARAARNAIQFGVPGLRVEVGRAGEVIERLAPPDAIFVGGGARDEGLLERLWAALPSGGRLVVNAVTLETEALVMAQQRDKGGSLTRIAIERAAPVGRLTGWRPAMPVVQWVAVKA